MHRNCSQDFQAHSSGLSDQLRELGQVTVLSETSPQLLLSKTEVTVTALQGLLGITRIAVDEGLARCRVGVSPSQPKPRDRGKFCDHRRRQEAFQGRCFASTCPGPRKSSVLP